MVFASFVDTLISAFTFFFQASPPKQAPQGRKSFANGAPSTVRNMSLSASLMNRRYTLCILLLYLILIGEGPKREIEAAFEEVAIEMGNSWMKSACGFVVGL